jgi:hypothetical protein
MPVSTIPAPAEKCYQYRIWTDTGHHRQAHFSRLKKTESFCKNIFGFGMKTSVSKITERFPLSPSMISDTVRLSFCFMPKKGCSLTFFPFPAGIIRPLICPFQYLQNVSDFVS